MSNPTSNFGWQMPTATDLVTDLPADFEVFGQAVDTDFVDLLGGTTGQILSKTSATDLDFTWIANDQGDITGVTAGNGISVTDPTGPVPTVAINTAVTADLTTAQTLTNKKLSDSTTTIVDVSDATKAIKFDVAGTTGITGTIATAFTTAKTVTIPDTTGTVALTNGVVNNTLTTTTGDIIYASAANTPARLGIGTTGQSLVVASGIPSWATPAAAASGLTLIKRASFSNVASTTTTFDTIFSSTYKQYMVVFENVYGASISDIIQFQLRKAGATTAANYYASSNRNTAGSVTFTAVTGTGGSAVTQPLVEGTTATGGIVGCLFFNQVNNASTKPGWSGTLTAVAQPYFITVGGMQDSADTYDGLLFKSSSGNITGTVAIYGLAAA